MDLKLLCYDYFVLIFLLTCRHGLCFFEDDYDDTPSFGRCPWIRNKLKNGRVKLRSRGRIAKFLCDPGYELAGKRFATCVRGQWNNPIPVCVARGCPKKPHIRNGRTTEMHRGAMLVYDCNPGYTLDGSISIYCDGRRWNSDPPACVVTTSDPETSCDFEEPDLCGWSHDPTHDFDWKRNQFSTPSGHVGTGPSYDHTFGVGKGGFYLYLEASSPRKENDVSRLFSPVYPSDLSGGCFIFWYHMYGATTGGLRVYLKPESHVFGELSPAWKKSGDQGNQWLRGHIPIASLHESFQLVIEGIRGTSYVGDSAIDDVQLTKSDCESMENATDTVADTVAESCRGRCRESDEESVCGCNENCLKTDTCCSDYVTICTSGNDTSAESTDEFLPVEEPATTKSPVTVNIIGSNTTAENTETEALAISPNTTTEITKAAITTMSSSNLSTVSSSTISSTSTTLSTTSTTLSTTSTTLSTTSTTLSTTSTPIALPTTSTTLPTTSTTLPTTSTTLPTTSTTVFLLVNSTMASSKPTSSSKSTTSSMPNTTVTTTAPSTTILIPETVPTISTERQLSEKNTTLSTLSTVTTTGQSPTSSTNVFSTLISVSTSVSSSSISKSEYTSSEYNSSTRAPLVPVSANVKNEDVSSSVSTTSITSTPSTRKTYNLRPRTQKTTPSTQKYYSSTSSPYTPVSTTSSTTKKTRLTSTSSSNTIKATTQPNVILLSSSIATSTSSAAPTTRHTSKPSVKTVYWYRITTLETVRDPGYTETSYGKNTTPRSLNDRSSNAASKAEQSTSNGSIPTITIASISVVSILIVAGGLAYYMKKHKAKRQSKLSDDSEMRFLSENEEMEYSDASVLDRILVK